VIQAVHQRLHRNILAIGHHERLASRLPEAIGEISDRHRIDGGLLRRLLRDLNRSSLCDGRIQLAQHLAIFRRVQSQPPIRLAAGQRQATFQLNVIRHRRVLGSGNALLPPRRREFHR
jgi:hypothetical protein